jgi:cyclohexyl-isocyanide hydratase
MRILMPVYQKFDLLDVCGPSEMFGWAGYTVDLVAEVPGPVTANNGFVLEVPNGCPRRRRRTTRCGCPAARPTSSRGSSTIRKSAILGFISKQAAQSTWVCSVCEGALLAPAAGLLDGYTATTHWAFIPYLIQNNPKVTVADGHPRFALDRNRLTGGGISSGLDEALQLITLLSGETLAQSVQQTTQYYPDPPVSSEIPNVITTPMMPPPS